MKKKQKAQSTLEYVILATAVIVVIIAMVLGKESPFKKTLNSTLNTSIGHMNTLSQKLGDSYGDAVQPAQQQQQE